MSGDIRKDDERGVGELLISGVKGAAFGIAVTLVLTLIFTAIALAFADPDAVVGAFAYAALGISAILTGFTAIKADSERSILSSILAGAMLVLVLWLVSLFVRGDSTVPALWSAIGYAACIIMSMLGGVIGRGRHTRSVEGKNSPTALMRKRIGTGK